MSLLDRATDDLGEALTALAGPLLPALLAALFGPVSAADVLVDSPNMTRGVPLFDLAATPYPRYVAQLGGVEPAIGLTDAQVRILGAGATAVTKGTLAGLRAAVQATLTGTLMVHVTERAGGDAYAITVATYNAETPNPTLTRMAAASVLPVGIVVTYTDLAGWTWEEFRAEVPLTWEAARTAGTTWEQLGARVPII